MGRRPGSQALGTAKWAVTVRNGVPSSARLGRRVVRMGGRVTRALGISGFVKRHVLPHLIMATVGDGRGRDMLGVLEREVGLELDRIAGSGKRIIVGPWTSEVGFEVLYWVPFVRWFAISRSIDPARLFIVSRGGAGIWYGDLDDGGYLDAFEVMTADDFRCANEATWKVTGLQKQVMLSALESRLIDVAGARTGSGDADILHPKTMNWLFAPYWNGQAGIDQVTRHLAPGPAPRLPDLPAGVDLPDDFVAVRVYARPSFPASTENRDAIRELVSSLSRRRPVVLLHVPSRYDDHEGFDLMDMPGVGRASPPDDVNNLAFQTAVIARASVFLCTYGGLAYVGSQYGVPTFGLCSDHRHIKVEHHAVALGGQAGSPNPALLSPHAIRKLIGDFGG